MSAFSSAFVQCPVTFEELRDAILGGGGLDLDAKCRYFHLLAAQHKKAQGTVNYRRLEVCPNKGTPRPPPAKRYRDLILVSA